MTFSFFLRVLVHKKSYEDAFDQCLAMGSEDCTSRMLSAENVPSFLDDAEEGTPDMLWVEGTKDENGVYVDSNGT